MRKRALDNLCGITGNMDTPGGMRGPTMVPIDGDLQGFSAWAPGASTPPAEIMEKQIGMEKLPLLHWWQYWSDASTVWDAVLEDKPYPVRALWNESGNFMSQTNTARAWEALCNLEFFVDLNLWHTPSTDAADIILPVAHWIELNSPRAPRCRRCHFMIRGEKVGKPLAWVTLVAAMVIVAIVLYAGITSLIESARKIIEPELADYSLATLIVVAAAVLVKIALDTMTAAQIDAMTRRVQASVLEQHHIVLATVGIYSRNTSSDEIAEMLTRITHIAMDHDGVLQLHGFYVDLEHKRASFDLIIDFGVPNRDDLYEHIVNDVRKAYPDFDFQITLDRDLSD